MSFGYIYWTAVLAQDLPEFKYVGFLKTRQHFKSIFNLQYEERKKRRKSETSKNSLVLLLANMCPSVLLSACFVALAVHTPYGIWAPSLAGSAILEWFLFFSSCQPICAWVRKQGHLLRSGLASVHVTGSAQESSCRSDGDGWLTLAAFPGLTLQMSVCFLHKAAFRLSSRENLGCAAARNGGPYPAMEKSPAHCPQT